MACYSEQRFQFKEYNNPVPQAIALMGSEKWSLMLQFCLFLPVYKLKNADNFLLEILWMKFLCAAGFKFLLTLQQLSLSSSEIFIALAVYDYYTKWLPVLIWSLYLSPQYISLHWKFLLIFGSSNKLNHSFFELQMITRN